VCISDFMAAYHCAPRPPRRSDANASACSMVECSISAAVLPQGLSGWPLLSHQRCIEDMLPRCATGQKEHGSGDAPRCLPCETGDRILAAIGERGGAVGDTGFAPPVVRRQYYKLT